MTLKLKLFDERDPEAVYVLYLISVGLSIESSYLTFGLCHSFIGSI